MNDLSALYIIISAALVTHLYSQTIKGEKSLNDNLSYSDLLIKILSIFISFSSLYLLNKRFNFCISLKKELVKK